MAEKFKMASLDMAAKNIDYISERFPNAVIETVEEGRTIKKIDFAILQQELSLDIIDEGQERYQFTWPGKKKAIASSNEITTMALRPVEERSSNFNQTNNLYIEGDNLDALKIMRETYLGKVRVIYIDPPYNTGNDFVYRDNFQTDEEDYLSVTGQIDNVGNRLFINSESNGRFHSDWLNLMYPRLKIAKDFLSQDGVIFISIDDHEQANLKKMCDEIFGEKNFIAQIIWERAYAPVNLKKHFSESHDYILCYAKNIDFAICNGLPKTADALERYKNPDNDPRGPWKAADATVGPAIPAKVYGLTLPSGRVVFPSSGRCWLFSQERFQELIADNRIWFGPDGDSVPSVKKFASEVKQTMTPMTIWKYADVGHSQDASKYLMKLFDGKAYFDYPKPVSLIKQIISLYDAEDCIVMDFFSGSGTTAEAVMEMNSEDGKNRRYILVQLQEPTDTKSEAYQDGYKDICQIAEERIRRAAKTLRETSSLLSHDFDEGFRVFRVDTTNMRDVYYNPGQTQQSLLTEDISNIKSDRSSLDLVFQCMLELGADLSSPIEEQLINGKQVYFINGNYLAACFASDIDEDLVRKIAEVKPVYAIFRDACFSTDSANINCEQLFKAISPSTTIKVL